MRKSLLASLVLVSSYCFADTPSGQKLFESACKNCHSAKVASGIQAPPAHDLDAWKARLEKANAEAKAHPDKYKDGFDYLIQHVMRGKGLMHHGGLCKESIKHPEDCTPEAYRAAIQFMSSKE